MLISGISVLHRSVGGIVAPILHGEYATFMLSWSHSFSCFSVFIKKTNMRFQLVKCNQSYKYERFFFTRSNWSTFIGSLYRNHAPLIDDDSIHDDISFVVCHEFSEYVFCTRCGSRVAISPEFISSAQVCVRHPFAFSNLCGVRSKMFASKWTWFAYKVLEAMIFFLRLLFYAFENVLQFSLRASRCIFFSFQFIKEKLHAILKL